MKSTITILLLVLLTTCSPEKKEPRTRTFSEAEVLSRTVAYLNKHLATVYESYGKGDVRKHAEFTASFILTMNQVPLHAVQAWQRPFLASLSKHGLDPYPSILLELTYRLSRNLTHENLKQLRAYRVVLKKYYKAPVGKVRFAGMIRNQDNTGYRFYNEGYVRATAAYALTDNAISMINRGGRPENLLRLLIQSQLCKDLLGTNANKASTAVKNCIAFSSAVAGDIAASGYGPQMENDFAAGISGGVSSEGMNCLMDMANKVQDQLIANMEAQVACRESERLQNWGPNGFTPDGGLASVASGVAPNLGSLSGYLGNRKFEKATSSTFQGDSRWGKQVDYTYGEQGSNNKTTVSRWITGDGNSSQTGTKISVENAAGTTDFYIDSNGNLDGVYWEGSGENSGTSYYAEMENGKMKNEVWADSDGSITKNSYDSRGNVNKVETTNADGSTTSQEVSDDGTVTTKTTDAEGNTTTTVQSPDGSTSSSTTPAAGNNSASQPVDEYGLSNCGPSQMQVSAGANPQAGGINPHINPNPDGDIQGFGGECLTAFLQDNSPSCPPSVAQCLTDVPPTGCGCGTGSGPSNVQLGDPGFCATANCGPDGACNPSTGSCSGGPSNASYPPVVNLPIGKIPDLGLGSLQVGDIRNSIGKGVKLWNPTGNLSEGMSKNFQER